MSDRRDGFPAAPDRDRPYEPWRPRPGQRVRVRLSGECPLHDGGAIRRVDDATGVVEGAWAGPWCVRYPGHVWRVRYDVPRDKILGGHYAAAELEPLP